jgi:hypothetical protein
VRYDSYSTRPVREKRTNHFNQRQARPDTKMTLTKKSAVHWPSTSRNLTSLWPDLDIEAAWVVSTCRALGQRADRE